uniref:EamA domain-containing protein n=1 Tax=Globisporangium ultimum (strain ATCC 200006 / CBS 805.95 / DAOM BR144) TaxID=431595 RepID=K3WGK3_GLOUD
MGFKNPILSLGTDAGTGKAYHICSRKSLLSFAVITLLVLSMSSERFMFKLMVDRMESYRYFLCQLMTFLFIPPLFCIIGYKSTQDDFIEEEATEFPKLHFFAMGILDLLHAMLLFLAGGKTEPIQTLLFMQASIPLSALISSLVYGTRYTRIQILGMLGICGGILVSLLPNLEDLDSDRNDDRESAWNSLFYLLAAVPGSLSMIYKERAIRDQPMDMVYLNAWVSVYQFIGGLMIAPIIFDAEFLHLNQKMSGLECLINGKAEVTTDGCELGIVILVLYVLCNVCINLLLMQVIKMTSIAVMYGTTLVGFFLSFGVLAWYQMDPDEFGAMNFHDGVRDWIPDSIYVDVVAFVILFAGKVLYQWDEDPDVEATTRSAEDKEAASLLNDDEYGLRYM